jgi:hypothetical protein
VYHGAEEQFSRVILRRRYVRVSRVMVFADVDVLDGEELTAGAVEGQCR